MWGRRRVWVQTGRVVSAIRRGAGKERGCVQGCPGWPAPEVPPQAQACDFRDPARPLRRAGKNSIEVAGSLHGHRSSKGAISTPSPGLHFLKIRDPWRTTGEKPPTSLPVGCRAIEAPPAGAVGTGSQLRRERGAWGAAARRGNPRSGARGPRQARSRLPPGSRAGGSGWAGPNQRSLPPILGAPRGGQLGRSESESASRLRTCHLAQELDTAALGRGWGWGRSRGPAASVRGRFHADLPEAGGTGTQRAPSSLALRPRARTGRRPPGAGCGPGPVPVGRVWGFSGRPSREGGAERGRSGAGRRGPGPFRFPFCSNRR